MLSNPIKQPCTCNGCVPCTMYVMPLHGYPQCLQCSCFTQNHLSILSIHYELGNTRLPNSHYYMHHKLTQFQVYMLTYHLRSCECSFAMYVYTPYHFDKRGNIGIAGKAWERHNWVISEAHGIGRRHVNTLNVQ